MITPLLKTALEPIAEQHRRLRLMRQLTIFWAIVALAGVVMLVAKVHPLLCFGLLVGAALAGAWFIRAKGREWEPDWRGVARRVEEHHPDLHSLLITAVEQNPDSHTRQLNYLQQRVIAEAVRQSRLHNWLDVVPPSRSAVAFGLQAVTLAALLAVIVASFLQHRPFVAAHPAAEKESLALARDGVEVTPGDAELERGSGLVVLATFRRNEAPSEATLVIQPQNQPERRMPLTKNLDDPAFGGGLPEVAADMTYRVEYAGRATRDFKVKVFDHPRLDRADATLHYPTYTKLPEKTVPDTHRVTAVEGTKLDVAFQLNKPVKSAALVAKDGQQVPLVVESGKPVANLRGFDVRTSQNYELRLVDADGRTSKTPAQFAIAAVPNRRPELKFLAPKGDQRVSPIEEVAFHAQAWDDFGLVRYGVAVNVAGQGEKEIELGKDSRPDEKRDMSHLLKLEDAGVKPDEMLSWYVWAEDIGPDGKVRRTATDMFFGEVRPFEEIFRQGDDAQAAQEQRQQQQQQQGGGGGDQATKLADLQKQVITATWNLKRNEDTQPKSPSEKYVKDLPVVRDGQGDALQQAAALNEQAADNPKTRALVENVTKQMQVALDKLKASEQTPAPLPDALAAEQAAYSALLKLASHEFNVARSRQNRQQQQAGGGGQQQDRQRQQLDQLELKDEKQRYETKNEATKPQNEQQRSQLATINRLKELAQRQQDINERLKELQTALQAAKTEPEKEAARQQLKRLREEEQQMLADMDETRQQMEQSPNQGQMAEDRRRLDETRAEAQKASEAMNQGAASKALASGSRTQQQLQDMRDDLRKKTSGQFNDDMRQMRADARELAQNEQGIADQLNAGPTLPKPERRSLDGSSDREKLADQLKKQQTQLASITEQMKRVSEQAETAEPLLSKELYDTLRKNAQSATDQKLKNTQLLAERGYPTQAQQIEQKAREEIEDLKSGVERAAESVLGNEGESLRQARAELDTLSEQLDREIAQARPDLAANNNRQQGPSQARNGQLNGQPAEAGQSPNPGDAQPNDRKTAQQGQPGGQNGQSVNARNQLAQNQRGQRGGRTDQPQNQQRQPGDPSQQPGQSDQPGQDEQPGQTDPSAQGGARNQLAQNQRSQRGTRQPGQSPQGQLNPSGESSSDQQSPNGQPGQPSDQQARNGADSQQPSSDQQAQSGQQGQSPSNQPGGRRSTRGQTARNQSPNGADPQSADANQPNPQDSQPQPGNGQPGQRQGQGQQQIARNGQRPGGQRGDNQPGQPSPQGQPGENAASQQQPPGGEQDQNAPDSQDPSAQTAQAIGGDGRGSNRSASARQNSGNGGGNQANEAGQNSDTPEDAQRRQRLAQLLDANSPARRQQARNGGARNNNNNGGGGGNGGAQYDGGDWNGGNGQYTRPLTGEEFVQWSDRLRNVEEMLDAPDLRNEASRIRELARGVRVDYKRNNAMPNWDMVHNKISQPLAELRNRLTEELARRESKENLVPIDRDPVPNKYAEGVRRYYEELGLSR